MTVVAIDTETCLIQPKLKAPDLICVSWARGAGSGIWKWDEPNSFYEVRNRLQSDDHIVGHNIAYDMAVLANAYPDLLSLIFQAYDDNRITCTLIRQKLADIATGRVAKYSLADLSERHLGEVLKKEDTYRLRYAELRDVPLEDWPLEAREYPVKDAVTTLRVYERQEVKYKEYFQDEHRQARHAFWLHLMSCWGIRTDLERVHQLELAIRKDLEVAKETLTQAGLLRFDGTRDTAVAKARMESLGSTKRTPKGAVSLDDEACRATGDAILIAYADYTHLAGMLAKDIEALRQGEIHARINSLLETGRISAGGNAENGGYNITNPARKGGVRECFVPRPGYVFVDADYDGLELRTMAQVCLHLLGESRMAEVLNAGQDPHLMLAAQLLGTTYEDATARYLSGDAAAKEARQFAKIANFGFAGGMGVSTFVEYAANNGIVLTEAKAREIRAAWLSTFPEFHRYFARAAAMTQNGKAQIEQLYSGRFRGGVGYSQLCNSYFQGLGADAAKSAGWALTKACYLPGTILYGCRVVNFIHDQVLVEVPVETAAECAAEVGRILVEEANRWLPDVPAKTSPCLATCWSKDAKAVMEDGVLVPWAA